MKTAAPAVFLGWQETLFGRIGLFNLLADIPGHPKGSTVTETTLREAGFDVKTR